MADMANYTKRGQISVPKHLRPHSKRCFGLCLPYLVQKTRCQLPPQGQSFAAESLQDSQTRFRFQGQILPFL
jgi:hypothetical protein